MSPDEIQDALLQLLERTRLRTIEFHELHAARNYADSSGATAGADPEYEMRMQTRIGDTDFGVLLEVHVQTPFGDVRVSAAAEYDNTGPAPEEAVLHRFANEVGVMALVPYLRQGIADLTQRVFGQSLLMPIVRREDVRSEPFDQQPQEPEQV